MVKMEYEYDAVSPLYYKKDGHYHIYVPTFLEFNNYANDDIDFIFDTGAFITVVTIQTSLVFGFNKLPSIKEVTLTGYTGSCHADIKSIPGLIIGGRIFENVKVAIPHENSEHNILGLNVLEYFNYLFSSKNSMIYFSKNPDYKAPAELMPGNIYLTDYV
jgi:predicted aspartyl protease